MQISVTFRNMEPSTALREYASDKVQRLKKYMAEPVDVHVVLAKHKYRNQAEVKVTSRGTVMKGVEHTEDMYSSIDLVMDKIERQARKRGRRSLAETMGGLEVEHAPREGCMLCQL